MENTSIDQPQSVDDYVRQGWEHYGKGDLSSAEELFKKAISLSPAEIDAFHGLGLALKTQGKREEAIDTFQKLVDLLEKDNTMDNIRRTMLMRLSKGQINLLKFGDWGLEKEIWKRER
jgi:tetratricopeptide (TPR) repeat protein